jgi:uncharacterized protein YukE
MFGDVEEAETLMALVVQGGGPPYPNPVAFNHAAADAAVAALQRAARQLQQVWPDVSKGAIQAQANWKGNYADRFRSQFKNWQSSTVPQLINQLLHWASVIAASGTAAADLQRQQDLANQAWAAEQRAQQRAS